MVYTIQDSYPLLSTQIHSKVALMLHACLLIILYTIAIADIIYLIPVIKKSNLTLCARK